MNIGGLVYVMSSPHQLDEGQEEESRKTETQREGCDEFRQQGNGSTAEFAFADKAEEDRSGVITH